MNSHWLSKSLEARQRPDGQLGVFALEDVPAGAVLTVWGGTVVPAGVLHELGDEVRTHAVQVDDALFLAPSLPLEPADFFNHCCAPNAGVRGQITLVAMRAISAGEEVCFDYAMTDSAPYDQFVCSCGAGDCRGEVSADDWKRADLQRRYGAHFSTYLLARIQRESQADKKEG